MAIYVIKEISIGHRLGDANRYQLTNNYRLRSDHRRSSIGHAGTYYGKFMTYSRKSTWLQKQPNGRIGAIRSPFRTDQTSRAISALADCSPQKPSQHSSKSLRFFVTTLVGDVSCETSFSDLRSLTLWTHSSMTEEHLSGLAMMLLHRRTNDRSNACR